MEGALREVSEDLLATFTKVVNDFLSRDITKK